MFIVKQGKFKVGVIPADRLGCLLLKIFFVPYYGRGYSSYVSWGKPCDIFGPIWSSCMHKCILLLCSSWISMMPPLFISCWTLGRRDTTTEHIQLHDKHFCGQYFLNLSHDSPILYLQNFNLQGVILKLFSRISCYYKIGCLYTGEIYKLCRNIFKSFFPKLKTTLNT
jgi:hypothetical protein